MEDGRQKKGDRKCDTEEGRPEMGEDRRQEKGDNSLTSCPENVSLFYLVNFTNF